MSKFNTRLTVDVSTIVGSLPKGSFLHSVMLIPPLTDQNRADIAAGIIKQEVVIVWENTNFESGLTVPIDFPIEEGKRLKPPEGVLDVRKPRPATLSLTVEENVTTGLVEPLKDVPVTVYLTEQEVNQAMLDGKDVEFQGIEIGWKRFVPFTSTYTKGFFYRLAEKMVEVSNA